jgi:hypothetical protein
VSVLETGVGYIGLMKIDIIIKILILCYLRKRFMEMTCLVNVVTGRTRTIPLMPKPVSLNLHFKSALDN